RLGGIDHLEETHRIDGYHGIVFRDDFLRRNIQHRFHHVDLATDGVDKRHNDAQARLKAMGITTKTLHRVLVTLRHTLDAHDNHEHYKYRERSGNNRPSHLLTLRIQNWLKQDILGRCHAHHFFNCREPFRHFLCTTDAQWLHAILQRLAGNRFQIATAIDRRLQRRVQRHGFVDAHAAKVAGTTAFETAHRSTHF